MDLLSDVTLAERLVACAIHIVGAMVTAWALRRWVKDDNVNYDDGWKGDWFLLVTVAALWPISVPTMIVMWTVSEMFNWLEL